MTAQPSRECLDTARAGAPGESPEAWDQINWSRVEGEVLRLQVRIAKATEGKHWNKVKALQRLLTRSFSAKAISVKRVTSNDGKRTPGVDGRIWSTKSSKMAAISRMKHRGYRPLPLRRIYIPKANGKERPLGIPTMADRAMQALWQLALLPVAETTADPNSYGFRPMRSTADAIQQCFCVLAQRASAQWVLEGDIRACFDRISHEWLIANVVMDKSVLQKWLAVGYCERGQWFPVEAGTPQGGIASPTLANMALDGLEATVHAAVMQAGIYYRKAKVHVIRYADDFIVTASSQEILLLVVKPAIEDFLRQRGLELAPEKTLVRHITQGFDFLGQNVRKYHDKLLIKPARKSVTALLRKVGAIIKKARTATQESLILCLNPILRGWGMYHRHIVSSETFGRIDNILWHLIWRWSCRRHPSKGLKWVKSRYYQNQGFRHWVFGCGKIPDGLTFRPILFALSSIKIQRHVKIQGAANPFHPAWEDYFARRKLA